MPISRLGRSPEIVDSRIVDEHGVPISTTAFGELRAVAPYTLADLTNKYDIDPNTWGTRVVASGSAVHVPAKSAVRMTTTSAPTSEVLLRTHSHYRYQAGKGTRWKITVVHDDPATANQTRNWGQFDENDGIFFRLDTSGISLVLRSSVTGSVTETVVPQSQWNEDKLDGTGPSKRTIDLSMGQIYEVSYQWLSFGDIHWVINGVLVHVLRNAGRIRAPYMRSAVLPIAVQVVNSGATSGTSGLTFVCATIAAEGGQEPPNLCFGAYNTAAVSTTVTERPLLSIRLKTLFNSIANRMHVYPFVLSVSTEAGRAGFRVVINSVLTGASWVSAGSTSGVEFDVSATAGASGDTLYRGFLPNTNDSKEVSLSEFFNRAGRYMRLDAFGTISDVLSVYGVNEATGTVNMRANLAWKEVR